MEIIGQMKCVENKLIFFGTTSKNTTSQPLEKRSKKKEVKKKKPLKIHFEAPTVAECRSLVQEPIAEAANEEVCVGG